MNLADTYKTLSKKIQKLEGRPLISKTLQTITEAESQKLLEEWINTKDITEASKRSTRDYTITLLMLDAGLRVGEVVNLTRNCLMFAGEFCDKVAIPADITKNRTERIIPMTDRLQAAVKQMHLLWWSKDNTGLKDYAFYSTTPDRPLSARQVQRRTKYASYKAFGRMIHPHVLRHTFATRLMRKTNIRIVQQLLGHKSITSTQVYTHPNDQDLKDAINTLNGD